MSDSGLDEADHQSIIPVELRGFVPKIKKGWHSTTNIDTSYDANGYVLYRIIMYTNQSFDEDLMEHFQIDFEDWTDNEFSMTEMDLLIRLQTMLRRQGVYVKKNKRHVRKYLHKVLAHTTNDWPAHEMNENFHPSSRIGRIGNTGTNTLNLQPIQPKIETVEPKLPKIEPNLLAEPNQLIESNRSIDQSMERLSIVDADVQRKIANLMKIFQEKDKYGGDRYEFIEQKAMIFDDCCNKVFLPTNSKHIVFSTMLKDKALEYYYHHLINRNYTLEAMHAMIKGEFETRETQRLYTNEWNSTTFETIATKFPELSKIECFEKLLEQLQKIQPGLDNKGTDTNKALSEKLLTACQHVPECALAEIKPATTLQGVCADLRNAINTATRLSTVQPIPNQQFWTDRRYTNTKKPYNKQIVRNDKSKCKVCNKLGCWSTNHPVSERHTAAKAYIAEMFEQFIQNEVSQEEDDNETGKNDFEGQYPAITEHEGTSFFTELGTIDGYEAVAMLNTNAFTHPLDIIIKPDDDDEVFNLDHRYSNRRFQGIMPDTGASSISTAGYEQVKALQQILPIKIDNSTAGQYKIRFGKGQTTSMGTVNVPTPIGQITFEIVPTNTPFLLCLKDMDRLKVRYDNINNTLDKGDDKIPIVRKWGHPFMLLDKQASIADCHLTEIQLRQIHRRFGHPSVKRLVDILNRADEEFNRETIERINKYCKHCQLYGKPPGRFKFTIKDEDLEFNAEIVADVLYLDNKPVLHVVDTATSFQAARFLRCIDSKTTWNAIRHCWIDVYQGPPQVIRTDAGSNFASREFRQLAAELDVKTKEVPVEAHNSVGKVERYHGPLKRAYRIIRSELPDANTDDALQMAVKAVNDSAGPNGLIPTLLVFGAFPRWDGSANSNIKDRRTAIDVAMKELAKLKVERQIADALSSRAGPLQHELNINDNVLVWREKKGWTGPFKLLQIQDQTCTIDMPKGPVNFRSTSVKPFFDNEPYGIVIKPKPRQIMTGVVLLSAKEQNDYQLSIDLRQQGIIKTTGKPFELSDRTEIDSLIANDVFKFQDYNPEKHRKLFNSRLVREIKNKTTNPYEKSRLVIQGYNDSEKELILTQSPTIQRASQRIIVALTLSLGKVNLQLRDVTQAYLQSTTTLNRQIVARVPAELKDTYPNKVMMVIKPLYGIAEAGTHWWKTYSKHHIEKLSMKHSSFDPCLMITTDNQTIADIGIIGLQTDDTLQLCGDKFSKKEEDKNLFKSKPKLTLTEKNPLEFNGTTIIKQDDNSIYIRSKSKADKLAMITTSNEMNKQYIEQRARGAYIASICQPEATFDLSVAAQTVEPSEEDVTQLNKRVQWMIDHNLRGLRYLPIDLNNARLYLFVDGSFANNRDLSSQIGYVIALGNQTTTAKDELKTTNSECQQTTITANIIHWSSVKCKRVTRSVLASEIYAMATGIDVAFAINSTINMIAKCAGFNRIPLVVCTDSFSLYECTVKLGTTTEKRLMIDIMSFREMYENREIDNMLWITGECNPADAMTKSTPNKALEQLVSTNKLRLELKGWVDRKTKDDSELSREIDGVTV